MGRAWRHPCQRRGPGPRPRVKWKGLRILREGQEKRRAKVRLPLLSLGRGTTPARRHHHRLLPRQQQIRVGESHDIAHIPPH